MYKRASGRFTRHQQAVNDMVSGAVVAAGVEVPLLGDVSRFYPVSATAVRAGAAVKSASTLTSLRPTFSSP